MHISRTLDRSHQRTRLPQERHEPLPRLRTGIRKLRLIAFIVGAAAGGQAFVGAAIPIADFQQLGHLLPTATAQRTGSGAPGSAYWQQRADYEISAELDEDGRRLTGSANITYYNNSPDPLSYLWVQLDRNFFAQDADNRLVRRGGSVTPERFPYSTLDRLLAEETFDGGLELSAVTDQAGEPLPHTIVKTMMRIDLPKPLQPGESFRFSTRWSFLINDGKRISTRTGYEQFDSGGLVFAIAQWYPRMAAYTDYAGWQNKQYLGSGEFTVEFGNYTVRLTVPADHVVGATGLLQNANEVLTAAQRQRMTQAESANKPVYIVTPDEARKALEGRRSGKRTWIFQAENVRDFAFASSRGFIWDAMGVSGHSYNGKPVMAMSLYTPDGMPLWNTYSTHAVAHAIQVYSRHTFPYPYPTAISVLGVVGGGMEYPMICFNGPRPEDDGTYPARTKYGLISVVIHEVGHNYFPMIVNADERQWMWMDEGLNSSLEFVAEREWENDYNSTRSVSDGFVDYMRRNDRVPVMTQADSIADLGSNAYDQPAHALNLLREVVLGRDLFDHAFRTYAQRWMFKRPTPADFFRTMEDASGVDLDWFWRSWFYSTDHVDVSIEQVRWLQLDSRNPEVEKAREKQREDERPSTLTEIRNSDVPKRVENHPELEDFYNHHDRFEVTKSDREAFEKLIKELEEEKIDPKLLETDRNLYLIDIKNVGGIITPLILNIEYTDGSSEELTLPAEVWRYNTQEASKLIVTTKELARVVFDPREELLDTEVENNYWPRRLVETPFQLYKAEPQKNPMRDARKAREEGAAEPSDP